MATYATWVLVADGARAQFYARHDGALEPALDHDLAVPTRAPGRKAVTDRPGRAFDSAGIGRHAMEAPTDWKTHEKQMLAHDVAVELRHALESRQCDQLVLVAPPEMLGDLRAVFTPAMRRAVVAEVGKDLTHLSAPELAAHLEAALRG